VPSASFSTGEGIEAVIGHDVEAVLAFHQIGHDPSVDHFDTNPRITRRL
jgi:hypothetical protein